MRDGGIMFFEITFRITPPGPFGVPEDGVIVSPGLAGKVMGDTFHTVTMTRVGYGTFPNYRQGNEVVQLPLTLGDI